MSLKRLHPNNLFQLVGRAQEPSGAARAALTIGPRGPWRHLRQLVVVILFLSPVALAQHHHHDEDTEPHFLHGQAVCADADSIMIVLDDVAPSRADVVIPELVQGLTAILEDVLGIADVSSSFPTRCAVSQGYLVVFARVTFLDEAVYANYGKEAFRYAVSIQVGDKADLNYLVEHNTLANLRFMAFDEQVSSEEGQGALPFEQRVVMSARMLLDQLAQAWQEDNP